MSTVEVRQLEYFLAVHDHGGVTRAAKALHLSQPSLSQAIRSLERQLRTELFLRVGRGLVLAPAGQALLGHRLFLPEAWCADTPEAERRREAAHIPEDVTFRTKPRIAAELIRDVAVLGQVGLDWVVGDSEYGRAGHLLDELELLEQRYVLEVPKTWVFWTSDPAGSVPAYSGRGRKPTAP